MKLAELPLPSDACLPDLYRAAMTGRLTKDYLHQIGNCLFGILGYTEVLLSQMPDDDPKKRRAKAIEEQALNLKHIIDALSEFSAKKEATPELTDIPGLLKSAGQLMRNIAVKARATVEEDYQELPLLMVDGPGLRQAVCLFLHFLITNNSDRAVRISTRLKSGYAEIYVSGGAGEETGEYADVLTMKNLSVYVGRQKVEELGGGFKATSENGMTTFTISLPCAAVSLPLAPHS